MPYTRGRWMGSCRAPSTRTIVPMPTAASTAVQKWNWCGVLGFRSVAATRPSARGGDLSIMRESYSRDRAEEFLAIADRVRHDIPPRIRQRERRRLGQHPARDLVGALRGRARIGGRGRDLRAHEPEERVLAGRIAEPQIPAVHRAPLARREPEH